MARPAGSPGRRDGIDVIPDRVRAARQEAGLSLAQLAADVVTPVAIHLIESGKSRPSPRTLMHIANRTGKPLGYFTDGEADLPAMPVRESSGRANRRMQEASWAISLALEDPRLTRVQREALVSVLSNLRRSVSLVRAIQEELEQA
ncbi:MAG: helix-turn-helix transcriptional regulator [Candidatus Dormibacteraeota bacterium]|nr:helix-turn-helix transcriptional regulator [Candidatus Dormibacteraeota bacterium]